MTGDDGQNRVLGPLPVLFAGVGPCAEKTLAELARMAAGLTVSVQGPFGLALVDPLGEVMFTGDWPWMADFRVPESLPPQDRCEPAGPQSDRLANSLSYLVRRLRTVEPSLEAVVPGRMRLNSYVLVDLSIAGVVPSSVRVIRALRQADAAHDMTVLALTARTAATDTACDHDWFANWTQLLTHLEQESGAQRVYLLDGCDADKIWLERPEQLHRLGAEFLLSHGLTCRVPLRQNEQARAGPQESVLSVCGSFGCRTITADVSVIAQRVAERLAREDLSDLYQRSIPDAWRESVAEQARFLVEKITGICEKARQTQAVLSAGRRDRPAVILTANAELAEAVTRVVAHVCSREPLLSLCHFFRCLQPKLAGLLVRQRLWERVRTRRLVAEVFRRQEEDTYEPLRLWSADPATRWVDQFTPQQEGPPQVAVSRPARSRDYLAGCLLMALGLAGVATGSLWQSRMLVVAGGLMAIASWWLMILPSGWVSYTRGRIREGQDVAESGAPAVYRRRAGRQAVWLASGLIALGLANVVGPLGGMTWTAARTVWAGALALIAGAGILFLVCSPTKSHPQRVSDEEAPGHADPPAAYSRVTGFSCLALAWMMLWWWAPLPGGGAVAATWLIQVAGLLCVAVGVGLAGFPRAGQAYLIDRVPRMPQPLAGGIGCRVEANEMTHQIAGVVRWINSLAVEPAQCLRRLQTPDGHGDRETLFDFLSADWDKQLAQAVRNELKARSEKTLHNLALQPVLWTECVAKELVAPHAKCPELTSLFALRVVQAWVESHTLTELLSYVRIDLERFRRLTSRLACPHWPATRADPDTSASVIAVGKPLWNALGPLMQTGSSLSVVPLDWDPGGGVVLAMRVVQGLTQGWRGFPGLPGQLHERLPSPSAALGSGDRARGGPELPSGG